jgi:hypothetical protein
LDYAGAASAQSCEAKPTFGCVRSIERVQRGGRHVQFVEVINGIHKGGDFVIVYQHRISRLASWGKLDRNTLFFAASVGVGYLAAPYSNGASALRITTETFVSKDSSLVAGMA